MKKLVLIAMIGLVSMLVGCSASFEDAPDKNNTWLSHGQCTTTKVIEIEGHKYIIMVGVECCSIIHAESCGCKK